MNNSTHSTIVHTQLLLTITYYCPHIHSSNYCSKSTFAHTEQTIVAIADTQCYHTLNYRSHSTIAHSSLLLTLKILLTPNDKTRNYWSRTSFTHTQKFLILNNSTCSNIAHTTQILFTFNNSTHSTIAHDKLLIILTYCSRSHITHTQLLFTHNYCSQSTFAHTHVLLRPNNNTHTQATIVHDKLLLKINFYSLSMITHTQLLPTRNYWSRSTSAHTQLLLRLNKTDIYSFVNKVPYKANARSFIFFIYVLLSTHYWCPWRIFTKNIYQFLQVAITILNFARTDIYLFVTHGLERTQLCKIKNWYLFVS